MAESPPANAGDTSSVPGQGRCHMPRSNEAHEAQLLSHVRPPLRPAHLEPVLCNKRSRCNEKPGHRNREWPLLTTATERLCSSEDPGQPTFFLKRKVSLLELCCHPEKVLWLGKGYII